jgi:hypothetical protein
MKEGRQNLCWLWSGLAMVQRLAAGAHFVEETVAIAGIAETGSIYALDALGGRHLPSADRTAMVSFQVGGKRSLGVFLFGSHLPSFLTSGPIQISQYVCQAQTRRCV